MLGAASSQLSTLPVTDHGLDAVRSTLKQMVAIARRYRADVTTIDAASSLIRACGIADVRSQKLSVINCIQNAVRDHIVYVPDPNEVEMLQTPPRTLSRGMGDCDDKSILVATLLETLGFSTEFLAVGGVGDGWGNDCADTDTPPYSHVLAAVQYGPKIGKLPSFLDGWLTLETIVPGAPPGYFPPGVRVIMPARVS